MKVMKTQEKKQKVFRTRRTEPVFDNYRDIAICNAIAHNKYLTYSYLNKLPSPILLCHVHPDTRNDLALKMNVQIPENKYIRSSF